MRNSKCYASENINIKMLRRIPKIGDKKSIHIQLVERWADDTWRCGPVLEADIREFCKSYNVVLEKDALELLKLPRTEIKRNAKGKEIILNKGLYNEKHAIVMPNNISIDENGLYDIPTRRGLYLTGGVSEIDAIIDGLLEAREKIIEFNELNKDKLVLRDPLYAIFKPNRYTIKYLAKSKKEFKQEKGVKYNKIRAF